MGFFGKLFKNRNSVQDSELDILDRRIDDKEERNKYVSSSLLQMKEISSEIDSLQSEYNVITEYLNDCDEIDRLPGEIKFSIEESVNNILAIRAEKDKYFLEEPLIDDNLFEAMERISPEMPAVYEKILDAEDFQNKIKSDLKKIDGEKQSYLFRRSQLNSFISNITGILIISTVAAAVCMIILLVLKFVLEMNVGIAFILTVTILIVVYCFLFLKGYDLRKESVRVDKTMIKIISLQNTVKIRLVNNTNLLDYLYIKYDIYSASELKEKFDLYVKEKDRREKYEKASVDLPSAKRDLLYHLKKMPLKDPMLWVHSPEALIDKKERVELRHELITRRQKIRTQIEDNTKEAGKIKDNIMELVKKYPKYSGEIMAMMEDIG